MTVAEAQCSVGGSFVRKKLHHQLYVRGAMCPAFTRQNFTRKVCEGLFIFSPQVSVCKGAPQSNSHTLAHPLYVWRKHPGVTDSREKCRPSKR